MKKRVFSASLAIALSACGGGGGGSDRGPLVKTPVEPGPVPLTRLAVYLGTWVSACDNREFNTATITPPPSASADSISIAYKTDYYANTNCTGAIVATWTQSAAVTAVYAGTVDSSIVFTPGTAAVAARVDKVTATLPAHTTSVVGSNVTYSVKNGQAQWCIDFGGGSSTCIQDNGAQPSKTVDGGLYLRDNEMFELTPNGSTFVVNERFVKK